MWPNPQETEDLVTFAEEILNGKPLFYVVLVTLKSHQLLKSTEITNKLEK